MSRSHDKRTRSTLFTLLLVVALVLGGLPTTVFAASNAAEESTAVTPTSPTGLGDSGSNYQPISNAAQMQLVFPNPLPAGGNYVVLGASVEIRARSMSSSTLTLRLANSSTEVPFGDTVSFSNSFTTRTITADTEDNGALLAYLQPLLTGSNIAINLLANRAGEVDLVRLTLHYEPITAGPVIQGECTAADIHLVVDNSISIGSNINTYKANIKSFMADVEAGMPGTNWRVTWFGTDPNQTGTVNSAWAANPSDLTSFIDQNRTQGYTPTANGINAAVAGGSVPPAPMVDNVNNLMIVLTDGAPNVILGGPAGFHYADGGAAAIEQAELARVAGWSTLTVMIGTGDPSVSSEWAANVNRGIAGVDVAGPSGDVLSVANFGTLAAQLIQLLAPGCERTVLVGKVVNPLGGVADATTFSGKVDAGTAAEQAWSGIGFGQFSAPIKVVADQFHVITEDAPAAPWSLTGWANGSFNELGAPVCPTDPGAYTGTDIQVPAGDPYEYSSVVVCVMNERPAAPAIDVEKLVSVDGQVSWDDSDSPTGPAAAVGADVYFKFVVTNIGNVPLAGISLTDSDFDLSGCTLTDPLAPGGSFECVHGPVAAFPGQHSNTATASGYSPTQQQVSDTDDAHYFGATLSVSKTADTSYTRTYTWSIDKTSGADYHRFIGDPSVSHGYTVSVDRTATDSDWAVSGTITIDNPTPNAATITGVTDVITPDIAPVVDCGVTFPYELAPGGTLTCDYSATLPDASSRTNTATVSTSGAVSGASTIADVIFGDPTIVGSASVNVQDTNGQSWAASDDASWSYTRDFTCPTDLSLYDANGVYSTTVDNVASIVETGQSDNALVTLTCYAPAVSKTATGAFTRTHTWNIEKTVNPSFQSGSPEDVLDWTWTVTVSETSEDSDFAITGAITVVNPNGQAALTATLTDLLSDGTMATIGVCTGGTFADGLLTVPAGGTAVCEYSAAPTSLAAGNTATLTLNNIPFSGEADVIWTPTLVNGTATLTDTQIGLDETLIAGEGPWTRTGSDSHTCALEAAQAYGTSGSYGNTVDNTATVTGSDGQTDSASASTTYTCSIIPAPAIDIEKYTNGEDADFPTGPRIPVGDLVTWTYVVSNTGNVPLEDVTVVDDNGTPADTSDDYTCVIGALAAGETDNTTCVQTGVSEPGQYGNIAVATGYFGNAAVATGQPALAEERTQVTDSDPSHYLGTLGSLKVTKEVEWNRATPDPDKSFEICLTGPSHAEAACVLLKDGESHTWTDLIPGQYVVSESAIVDELLDWTVEVVYADAAETAVVVAEETAEVTVLNTTDFEAPPTAVNLAGWEATVGQSGVLHTWRTGAEKGVSGFRVYRGSSASFDEAELVGEIAAKGPSSYQWVESGVAAGAWHYWLVEVDGTGAEMERFGPKAVTVGIGGQRDETQKIYLPLTLL